MPPMKRRRTADSSGSMEVSQAATQTRKTRMFKMPYEPNSYKFNRRTAGVFDEWVSVSEGFQMDFNFNELVNYSEFTALFDSYRIDRVEVTFQLVTNAYSTQQINSTSAQTTNWFPKIWVVPDYDGPSATVDTLAQIKERQNLKCFVLEPNKMKKVTVYPKPLVQTYTVGGTSGKAPKRMILDTAHVDVPHYGLTYVYDSLGIDPSNSVPFRVAVEKKFYFTMFGVK